MNDSEKTPSAFEIDETFNEVICDDGPMERFQRVLIETTSVVIWKLTDSYWNVYTVKK